MSKEGKFPLAIWEGTEEFKQEYGQASQRFQEIGERLYARKFRCTFLGDLRIDGDGYPEVWLNDNMPWSAHEQCKKPGDAISYVLQHGSCGWWSLDELEKFAQGGGPIFEEAMWKLGYRKNKVDSTKWAKKGKKDKMEQNGEHKQIEEIVGEELSRLNRLWVLPNESAGMGRTYNIQVGKRGLIYVALLANPFVGTTYETLWMFGAQASDRGHIAKQQDGFSIDSKNVRLGKKEGVYIKAVRPDNRSVECIWPIQTPKEKIYDLAENLVSRAGQLQRAI